MVINKNNTPCCKVETGAFVYGLFNVIISGAAILTSIIILIYYVYTEDSALGIYIMSVLLILLILAFLIVFLFSMQFVQRVRKRQPYDVRVYFIFEMALAVLVVAASIAIAVFCHVLVGCLILIAYLTYSLPLVLVWMTYQKFKSEMDLQLNNI